MESKAPIPKEARFWETRKEGVVQCRACNRNCVIAEGKTGLCRVRKNFEGKLRSLVYGKTLTLDVDPVEKKPLFHFRPGTECLGISTYGCNFFCQHCFTPETLIATDAGVKKIKDLYKSGKNERKELNFNVKDLNYPKAITHNGTDSEIIHSFEHHYDGVLLSIKPHYTPGFSCTPNHELFVCRARSSNKIEKIRADELCLFDYLVIPKIKINPENKQVLDTKKILSAIEVKTNKAKRKVIPNFDKIVRLKEEGCSSREIGKIIGLHPAYVGTFFSKLKKKGKDHVFHDTILIKEKGNRVKFKNEKGKGVPKKLPINGDFASLLGYYCSEGCIIKHKKRQNSYGLVFSFGAHEPHLVNSVKNLGKKIFGLEPKCKRTKSNTVNIHFYSSSVALLFKLLCGAGARNKVVPEILFRADKRVVSSFLYAYAEGDGWVGDGSHPISINTVSKELAVGVYCLFLRTGFIPSFHEWNPKPKKRIQGREINQSPLFYVKLYSERSRKRFALGTRKSGHDIKGKSRVLYIEKKNHYLIPVHRISKQDYTGLVYNLEVLGDHSYLANFVAAGNCQNFHLSQEWGEGALEKVPFRSPEEVVQAAISAGVPGIAYTYTEPTVFIEYCLDIMEEAKEKGLYNVFVSNGYMGKGVVKEASKTLDAINIDLKGNGLFYNEVCGQAKKEKVLENIKAFHERGVHVEVTNLIIPGFNDNEKDFRETAEFIASLDKEMPLHFSRFHPQFKMDCLSPTPEEKLLKAKEIAEKTGLKFVYLGNLGKDGDTRCKKCGAILVKRSGFSAEVEGLGKGKCVKCGAENNFIA